MLPKIKLALVPPNPNELDRIFLIFFFLDLFGTRSNSEVPSSGFVQLIVGGISWFWIAKIEKIASTAPAAPSKCPVKDFVELIDKLFKQ